MIAHDAVAKKEFFLKLFNYEALQIKGMQLLETSKTYDLLADKIRPHS